MGEHPFLTRLYTYLPQTTCTDIRRSLRNRRRPPPPSTRPAFEREHTVCEPVLRLYFSMPPRVDCALFFTSYAVIPSHFTSEQGIYPSMIILLVALQRSWDADTASQSKLASLTPVRFSNGPEHMVQPPSPGPRHNADSDELGLRSLPSAAIRPTATAGSSDISYVLAWCSEER